MDAKAAIDGLTALGQPTRLAVFRQLVSVYPEGLAAGAIARAAHIPHNTMSTHLAVLTRAGLLSARRDGRSLFYRADLNGFRSLVSFLTRDCCAGRPEICAPLLDLMPQPCGCEPEYADG